jgi:hypothetical protein
MILALNDFGCLEFLLGRKASWNCPSSPCECVESDKRDFPCGKYSVT